MLKNYFDDPHLTFPPVLELLLFWGLWWCRHMRQSKTNNKSVPGGGAVGLYKTVLTFGGPWLCWVVAT